MDAEEVAGLDEEHLVSQGGRPAHYLLAVGRQIDVPLLRREADDREGPVSFGCDGLGNARDSGRLENGQARSRMKAMRCKTISLAPGTYASGSNA